MPSRCKLHDIRRMVKIDIVKSNDAYVRNVLGIIPSPGFLRCHGHENRLTELSSTEGGRGKKVVESNTTTASHKPVSEGLPDDQILRNVVKDTGNLNKYEYACPYQR